MKKILNISSIILFWGVVFSIQPAYAYIDPGTGSMLFSIILSCCATLFFAANSLFIKIKQSFFTNKTLSKNNIPFVIYSEGNQYYSVFKPILDEFEQRKILVHYYTSDENDKIFDEKYEYINVEYIGKNTKAYLKLAFLKADICLMTIPQLDVLQLKRSKHVKHYSHIFHSITFSMDYHLFSLDYYDSVLCDAEFQIPLIRELEEKRNINKKELVVVGSTYMDYLQNKKNKLIKEENTNNIVIAPSWGPDGLLRKFGSKLIDNILKTDFNIIIRPHPQSLRVETELINDLKTKYNENKRISWDFDPDNLSTLNKTDILISDFSSVMFDYAFLFNKPFIYSVSSMNPEIYDFSDLDQIPYRFNVMKEIGNELTESNLDNIAQIVNDLKNSKEIENAIQKSKETSWMHRGNAAKNVVNFLINKQEEVSKC